MKKTNFKKIIKDLKSVEKKAKYLKEEVYDMTAFQIALNDIEFEIEKTKHHIYKSLVTPCEENKRKSILKNKS